MNAAVRVENREGIRHVMLHAPGRKNALSYELLQQLLGGLEGLDGLEGLILSGSGGDFSAGADFASLTGSSADVVYDDAVAAVVSALMAAPCPVLAAVEGACLGAAADVALACDVRVAGDGAFIAIPATRLGLLYNPAAIARIATRYPRDSVRRLLLLGERFEAHEARRAGLFSTVVPAGAALDHATSLIKAGAPGGADAKRATKALLDQLDHGPHDHDTWEMERRRLLDSDDRKRAIDRTKEVHG